MPMSMSKTGLDFLISLESLVTSMYNDNAGHCTVGVGHLVHKGNCDYPTLKNSANFSINAPFLPNATEAQRTNLEAEKPYFEQITTEKAQQLLKNDVKKFEDLVNKKVKVTLTQTQFDALVSFAFNVGPGSFSDSTLLKVLNDEKYSEVSAEIKRWVNSTENGVKKVNNGLVNRRAKEAALFDNGDYGTEASGKVETKPML